MPSQLSRKLQTRKAIMDAALSLVEDGSHYASLSLRVVSKRAGITPNAFYRHFKDLDELGLALTDELGLMLRQLMRQARMQGLAADRMINDSVNFYVEHVLENPALFRFMSQSLTGGSTAMREATRHELGYFAKEMVVDLSRLRILPNIQPNDMDMLGHLVVNTVCSITMELLDLPNNNQMLIDNIRNRTVKQVRLIFMGAGQWRSDSKKKKASKKQRA